jgi:L-asparaginase II
MLYIYCFKLHNRKVIFLSEILVNVYRNNLIESIHRGDIAAVNEKGQNIFSFSNHEKITYWRSAAKPVQALPVVFSGAYEKYNLSEKELAVICSSHNGEQEHVDAVLSILDKIGLDESALLCGVHPPLHNKTARSIWRKGDEPRAVHNNCSGKHAGLLTLCKYYGWSINDYYKPEHPAQRLILETIAEVSTYSEEDIILGVDGCGVVVFGLPLIKMAYTYYCLANSDCLVPKYQEAAKLIVKSMEKYPEMIGGTDRFNTDLMKVTGNKLFAKMGAEGVFCLGIHDKLGIAVKIEDGNFRAIPPVVIEILSQLNILSKEEEEKLSKYHYPDIYNHHKKIVGRIEADFNLI